ncbi:fumarylacetoacetate hydrolase [Naegleria gruberi]|uniref:Fumarylacetoacetate hydrolase n=1 Tax=Naegleria gruberi TaxID=5762 RepID=D2UZH1_NAEGR|nr:fumarylacetoacetate hydrolase [Naegleria gruberi]EFC50149.1 fumarylacetoacetate hydrolase [Naegleria gruberi]|eukprot:XP_002682893.1 fumarylacetoacetate hydrolase [Naegleria gruberi strain NEG-M]
MVKFATLKNQTRDGRLIIVNKEGTHYAEVPSEISTTMQQLLDDWDNLYPKVEELYKTIQFTHELSSQNLMAPLPRSYEWIDGSAYINHIVLVRKARNAQPPETLRTDPLVYQGGSGTFIGPNQDVEHFSEDYGIDFEGEVAVIVKDVPMGTKADQAGQYIKLVMICNDVSLRNLIPKELEKQFGFFVSKPSSSFSPFAVTLDELGELWKDGRCHGDLISHLNGKLFGNPNAGPEMFFSFHDLIQHVTQTRALTAGTIIGSGTVSNEDQSRGSSCIAEKRMIEKIETGQFTTPFMKFGDRIQLEMFDNNKVSIFGQINQTVVQKK